MGGDGVAPIPRFYTKGVDKRNGIRAVLRVLTCNKYSIFFTKL